MLSVIVVSEPDERALIPTLSTLVPGAVAGLVRDVFVLDQDWRQTTARIADSAGAVHMVEQGPKGERLASVAAKARTPWLLFVTAGMALQPGWTDEVARFISLSGASRAAVFGRANDPYRSAVWQAATLLLAAFKRPHPRQGLLIEKGFYQGLGGYRAAASDPERDLLRRIGRSRLVTLHSAARPAII